ncbi:hypothetical protein JTE90_021694 [Oedothorax gibbosus]|uniref:Uncharacterized protein n=1 Tax=Oedothorax gibbosus TaxID=931172 RepID=A0AAV6TU55_9ARAC|nr:hypothetical protein JTE90_021694 [Oedothorax gibbosus]
MTLPTPLYTAISPTGTWGQVTLEDSDSKGINHTTTPMTSPKRTPIDNSLLYNTIVYHWASDFIEELYQLDHSPVGTWEYLLDSALAYTDLDPDEALTLSEMFILLAIPTETPKISKPWKRCRKPKPIHISKRKLRREKHAIVQRLYAKNRSACYESLFKEDSFSEKLTSEQMFAFWENLLKDSVSTQSNLSIPPPLQGIDTNIDLLCLITLDEVLSSKLPFSSSPGPDSIKVSEWGKN